MIDENGDEVSDHILDNMTPEENLALELFIQAITAGKVDPTKEDFDLDSFINCILVANSISDYLVTNHEAASNFEIEEAAKRKLKVVPINKEIIVKHEHNE